MNRITRVYIKSGNFFNRALATAFELAPDKCKERLKALYNANNLCVALNIRGAGTYGAEGHVTFYKINGNKRFYPHNVYSFNAKWLLKG